MLRVVETKNRHSTTIRLMQLFEYKHLAPWLHEVAEACAKLARDLLAALPDDGPELFTGLQKLLEARDAFIRAALDQGAQTPLLADTSAFDVPKHDVVVTGPVELRALERVILIRGEPVHLPFKEHEILELFVRNAEVALARDTIIRLVWGADYFGDTKTLDVHVKRLRQKIELDPRRPRHLVTIRGFGYKFTVRDDAAQVA